MGTLGKALGASGGYICGSRALVDYLINRARTFIFSTAPVPAAAAAATAGVLFVQSSAGEERRRKLWQHASSLRSTLDSAPATGRSVIIPLLIGEESKAAAAAARAARARHFPSCHPLSNRGARQARLRLTLSAAHTHADLARLLAALKSLDFRL